MVIGDDALGCGADRPQLAGNLGQAGLDLLDHVGDLLLVLLVVGGGDLLAVGVDRDDQKEAIEVLGGQDAGGRLVEHAGDDEGVEDVGLADQGPQLLVDRLQRRGHGLLGRGL